VLVSRKWSGKTLADHRADRQEWLLSMLELQDRSARGIPRTDHVWKVGEYLDYWLENIVRPGARPTTYAKYETITRLYLRPLEDLRPGVGLDFGLEAQDPGLLPGGGRLSRAARACLRTSRPRSRAWPKMVAWSARAAGDMARFWAA